MERLTNKKALELLYKDVIEKPSDLNKYENRWVLHSLYVGIAAKRIANKLNIDEDYAEALGYVHDIGRKIEHQKHPIKGYEYMASYDYKTDAKICLTHSYINNDINLVAGGAPRNPATYDYINEFLNNNPVTIYDNIIQLCDLFCLETGFTTIEKRILDIYLRKGIYENSLEHFQNALLLKEKIEKKMNYNLYDLFPEIKKEDILSIENDAKQILEMIELENGKNNISIKKEKR